MLDSIAFSLTCGRPPGRPRQVGQVFVLAPEPNSFAQPQNILVAVFSSTCTSKPSTGSKSSRALS